MMNILYVWFPASWGPSVVEAIQTRNVTCLAKKPIVRDPHILDRKEAARGSRAREVTCRIQKWNIKAEGFHPILVANARVDWLAMDDDDITKKFPILLDKMLRCRSGSKCCGRSASVAAEIILMSGRVARVHCIRKGQPLRGKVPNRKNLRCQCSSQGPVLRQNGETYYNPDANSGLH